MKRQTLRTIALIIVTGTYLLIGAAIFGYLEKDQEVRQRELVDWMEKKVRWKYNISDEDYAVLTTAIIKSVPYKAGVQWGFSGAIYFATTVVTTIGYGHSTPSTMAGRSFCMVYALIGIPLGLVMFQSIGERINSIVGWQLKKIKRCLKTENPEVTQTNLVMVVLVLSTILMTSMAAIFAKYERWEYFDALYYCFITLTTIGFGDYVALQKESALQSKPEYVTLSLVFILFGLSVVSSAVNLLVLKFLTLNTEDERRDEQIRSTAALDPFELKGVEITMNANKQRLAAAARAKRLANAASRHNSASSSSALELHNYHDHDQNGLEIEAGLGASYEHYDDYSRHLSRPDSPQLACCESGVRSCRRRRRLHRDHCCDSNAIRPFTGYGRQFARHSQMAPAFVDWRLARACDQQPACQLCLDHEEQASLLPTNNCCGRYELRRPPSSTFRHLELDGCPPIVKHQSASLLADQYQISVQQVDRIEKQFEFRKDKAPTDDEGDEDEDGADATTTATSTSCKQLALLDCVQSIGGSSGASAAFGLKVNNNSKPLDGLLSCGSLVEASRNQCDQQHRNQNTRLEPPSPASRPIKCAHSSTIRPDKTSLRKHQEQRTELRQRHRRAQDQMRSFSSVQIKPPSDTSDGPMNDKRAIQALARAAADEQTAARRTNRHLGGLDQRHHRHRQHQELQRIFHRPPNKPSESLQPRHRGQTSCSCSYGSLHRCSLPGTSDNQCRAALMPLADLCDDIRGAAPSSPHLLLNPSSLKQQFQRDALLDGPPRANSAISWSCSMPAVNNDNELVDCDTPCASIERSQRDAISSTRKSSAFNPSGLQMDTDGHERRAISRPIKCQSDDESDEEQGRREGVGLAGCKPRFRLNKVPNGGKSRRQLAPNSKSTGDLANDGPRLVCKCCCQHDECIKYALEQSVDRNHLTGNTNNMHNSNDADQNAEWQQDDQTKPLQLGWVSNQETGNNVRRTQTFGKSKEDNERPNSDPTKGAFV